MMIVICRRTLDGNIITQITSAGYNQFDDSGFVNYDCSSISNRNQDGLATLKQVNKIMKLATVVDLIFGLFD